MTDIFTLLSVSDDTEATMHGITDSREIAKAFKVGGADSVRVYKCVLGDVLAEGHEEYDFSVNDAADNRSNALGGA